MIHKALEYQVNLSPNSCAITFEHNSLTYSEFNGYVNQLAHYLITVGIHRGVCVGIAMNRSIEMVISIFSILKAGGAYVPVDPAYPEDRVRFVFKDAAVDVLVTHADIETNYSHGDFKNIVTPDLTNWKFSGYSAADPDAGVCPDDLAYILFTSGSTGRPKGVMVEHHSLFNLVSFIQKEYPLGPGDTVLFKSPYTFDGSVWELFGWILPLGRLYIAGSGAEKDPGILLNTLISGNVSFMFFVSSMLSAFLEYLEFSKHPVAAAKLKWVSVGGEVVSPLLVNRFYNIFSELNTGLINVYGPTETTVYATTYLCKTSDNLKTPLGKPVENDFIYILDSALNILPPLTEGEIFIGGEGVARGYLNRPELTSEKFLSDPFRPGSKMYATGDIGRFLPDGNLDFIGRRDFQIKMRGLRIELGEIESALVQLHGVRDAVVKYNNETGEGEQLIAFIVRDTNSSGSEAHYPYFASTGELDRFTGLLRNTLPYFMIPTQLVVYDSFPVTENGKLDRKALQVPRAPGHDYDENHNETLTVTEKILLEIWKEVFALKKISIKANFFQIGGHSLKAAAIAARIIGKTGIEMPIRTIFENPDVSALAHKMDQMMAEVKIGLPEIKKIDRNGNGFPLCANQTELWFLHKMDVTHIQHNILFRLDIDGLLNADFFNKSVTELIRQNEILRTQIKVTEGVPMQFLCQPWQFEMGVCEIQDMAAHEQGSFLKEKAAWAGKQLFDLESGRLFSMECYRTDAEHHVIFFCIHHLIFDGWSMYNFFNGLKTSYINLCNGRSPGILKPEIQNIDYAVYQQNNIQHLRLQHQLFYWKQRFQKLPEPLKIYNRKVAAITSVAREGNRIWWGLSPDETPHLERFAETNNFSLFAILLSIYKTMLWAFSGKSDIVVGTPYANRNREEIEPLIGYFTNMLALRSQLKEEVKLIDFIQTVQMNSLDAFANSDLPFGQLVKELGLITTPGNYPLFQVVFVMQNWSMPEMSFNGLTLKQRELGSGGVKAELMFNAEQTEDGLECWLEYDMALYDKEIADKMVQFMHNSIKIVLQDYHLSLNQIVEENCQFLPKRLDQPSCLLIGESTLLTACGDLLLTNGFSIAGLISPDKACTTWARKNGVSNVTGYSILKTGVWENISFDFIFSIVNSKILNKELLLRARKGGVNYHDSLLPRYAGVHATSWAIINGEKTHGICWHVITPETDAGQIIRSEEIRIDTHDTAFTLNTKCYESAIQQFRQVIEVLLKVDKLDLVFIKPDSYFGLLKKPSRGGILDFRLSAIELHNQIRALHLGDFIDNHLASAKIITATGVFIVTESDYSDQNHECAPGIITKIAQNEVVISTANGQLIIKSVKSLMGETLPLQVPFPSSGIQTRLPILTDEKYGWIDSQVAITARYEKYWMQQLGRMESLPEPIRLSEPGRMVRTSIILPEREHFTVTGALILFLACYSNSKAPAIGVTNAELLRLGKESYGIFAEVLPYNFPDLSELICKDALQIIESGLRNCFATGSFLSDLISRIPLLRRQFNGYNKVSFSFIVVDNEQFKFEIEVPDLAQSNAVFKTGKGRVDIASYDNLLVEEIKQRLPAFMSSLTDNFLLPLSSVHMLFPSELNLHHTLFSAAPSENVRTFFNKFDECVLMYSDKTALQFREEKVNYKNLQRKFHIISSYLINIIGSNAPQIIGISLNRTPELITGILGILHSGNSYLPLDPKLPPDRLKTILSDSKVSHLLTSAEISKNLPDSVTCHCLEAIPDAGLSSMVKTVDDHLVSNAGYVIYTSGTTGKPKGVIITMEALNIFIEGTVNRYKLTAEDIVLQFASLAFDASVEEIFPALACGATLVIRTEESTSSVSEFLAFCRQNAITVLNLPTAFWHRMVDHSHYDSMVPESIRLVIIGGERAGNMQVNRWLASGWNKISLFNTYGPTETTVVATSFHLKPGESEEELPIGKPVFGVKAMVRNVFNQMGIPSKPNELIILGDIVSPGYLNQPDLSGKVFRMVKYDHKMFRSYSTGDLVSIRTDGNLCYHGRKDAQLKIRGFRVELHEIQEVISQIIGIVDCLVVPYRRDESLLMIIAYIVVNSDYRSDQTEVKIISGLPEYMRPHQLIEVPFIPLTINNKPDVNALPPPNPDRSLTSSESLPLTTNERMVYAAWEKSLGFSGFGMNQDFFKLGGNSLTALTVMSDLEKKFGKKIPLAALFTYPTVSSLAAAIEGEKEQESWRSLVCIKQGSSKIPLFIIHGGGLNVLLFNTLAQRMNEKQAVYGIQAHGLDGKSEPFDNIDDIAQHFISEIKSVQANGPYAIAGFSIGGLIAYELACRLRARSEQVAFLAIFDTEAHTGIEDLKGVLKFAAVISYKIRQFCFNFRLILTDPLDIIPKKLKWFRYRLRMKFYKKEGVTREDLMDLPNNLIAVARANIEAITKLKLKPYPGRIHLFRAEKRNFYVEDSKFLGWGKFAKDVTVHDIPGEHSRIFAPPNDILFATRLQEALDEAISIENQSYCPLDK